MLKLEGEKTYLVPFAERHLEDSRYFEWLTDLEVVRLIGRDEYLRPIRLERVREYVEGLWRNEFASFFAVHLLQGDEFVGTVKLSYGDHAGVANRCADVGVMIGARKYWGQGLATDALYTLCRYAFETLGARKLTAGTIAGNDGVVKAFTRIGFVEEGRLRKKIYVGGEFRDHLLLGCLRGELVPPRRGA